MRAAPPLSPSAATFVLQHACARLFARPSARSRCELGERSREEDGRSTAEEGQWALLLAAVGRLYGCRGITMSDLWRSEMDRWRCCLGRSSTSTLAATHFSLSPSVCVCCSCSVSVLGSSSLRSFRPRGSSSRSLHRFAGRPLSACCTSPVTAGPPLPLSLCSAPLAHSWVAPTSGGCAPAEPSAVCTAPPARADGTG